MVRVRDVQLPFLCIFGSFLKVKVQNGDMFSGCLIFLIVLGVLDIPDIISGLTVDTGSRPTYEESESTLPPHPRYHPQLRRHVLVMKFIIQLSLCNVLTFSYLPLSKKKNVKSNRSVQQ